MEVYFFNNRKIKMAAIHILLSGVWRGFEWGNGSKNVSCVTFEAILS